MFYHTLYGHSNSKTPPPEIQGNPALLAIWGTKLTTDISLLSAFLSRAIDTNTAFLPNYPSNLLQQCVCIQPRATTHTHTHAHARTHTHTHTVIPRYIKNPNLRLKGCHTSEVIVIISGVQIRGMKGVYGSGQISGVQIRGMEGVHCNGHISGVHGRRGFTVAATDRVPGGDRLAWH